MENVHSGFMAKSQIKIMEANRKLVLCRFEVVKSSTNLYYPSSIQPVKIEKLSFTTECKKYQF